MTTISHTHVPPVSLARLVERLRHRLYRAHQRLAPAPVAMIELILAGWMSQAIEAAAELGIADALAAGPLTAHDLAGRVGADADAVDRLLRALVSRGVFRRHSDGAYGLNPLADTLRSDAPASMAGPRCSMGRHSTARIGARWPRRSGPARRLFRCCVARNSSNT